MMRNPEVLRRTLDPGNMQAMLQMQQAMQQLQSSGFAPPLGGGFGGGFGAGAGAGGAGAGGGLDVASLMRGMGLGGLGAAAPAPAGDPAVLYAAQLEQLQVRPARLVIQSLRAARQPGRS
jgi:ubiquilin